MIASANPGASYLASQDGLDRLIRAVMESGLYIGGPRVSSFEEHFASYLGSRLCVGVANGTDALQLALRACGVGRGDGVITVSHTAVATIAAIQWIGAMPILVDIDPKTFTIDPQKLHDTMRRSLSGTVKAVVPVHLYGHPADMSTVLEIALGYHLAVIEDCAQAHGASIEKRKVGSLGTCGAFSFYPTKNLGAFGDGGAVVTNNEELAERLRLLHQYGWRERYISESAGYNSRLDTLQAAVLEYKLSLLDVWNQRRREIAHLYDAAFSALPIVTPYESQGCSHVYHQYVIRSSDRNRLRQYLLDREIQSSILYPVPVHQQPGYRTQITLGAGGMPETEQVVEELLCLPIYPELENSEVAMVIDAIESFFK